MPTRYVPCVSKSTAPQFENEVLKRAFFFAVLTGIRLCDIQDLTWGEIAQTGSGWRVDFTQLKTHVVDYLPISEQAYSFCGERGEQNQRVFEGLTGSSWISRPLKKWIEASGIKKHITYRFKHPRQTGKRRTPSLFA